MWCFLRLPRSSFPLLGGKGGTAMRWRQASVRVARSVCGSTRSRSLSCRSYRWIFTPDRRRARSWGRQRLARIRRPVACSLVCLIPGAHAPATVVASRLGPPQERRSRARSRSKVNADRNGSTGRASRANGGDRGSVGCSRGAGRIRRAWRLARIRRASGRGLMSLNPTLTRGAIFCRRYAAWRTAGTTVEVNGEGVTTS
jgi:hypothetical protein